MKKILALSALFASATCLTSCKTTGGEYSEYASSDDPYAAQGGYQPYGTDSGELPQYQQYTPPQESYTPEPAYTPPKPSYTPSAPASKPKTTPAKPKTTPAKPKTTPAKPKTTPAKPKTAPAKGSRSYVVRPGDTLYKVSRNHKVTVPALKKANGLSSDVIRVGQKLVIP